MKKLLALIFSFLFITSTVSAATTYPWRGTLPVQVTITSYASSFWTPYIQRAATEWSASSVLDVIVVTSTNKCSVKGKASLCAGEYGGNLRWGWTVLDWRNGNLTDAAIYLNESHLLGTTESNRQHVVCQETGNALGIADTGCKIYDQYGNSAWVESPQPQDFIDLETLYSNN